MAVPTESFVWFFWGDDTPSCECPYGSGIWRNGDIAWEVEAEKGISRAAFEKLSLDNISGMPKTLDFTKVGEGGFFIYVMRNCRI